MEYKIKRIIPTTRIETFIVEANSEEEALEKVRELNELDAINIVEEYDFSTDEVV